ncbi:MAG TPA: CPBP family intramembrane metalloprotease [Sediminispirochaeta sp.]|nr:CPBP family intramembrane metalloprotease [Sediminispirochaeta sp.]
MSKDLSYTIVLLLLACLFWYAAFVLDYGNFWLKLPAAVAFLAVLAVLVTDGAVLRSMEASIGSLFRGVASALVLYLIFLIGNALLRFLFVGAGQNIATVYQNREHLSLPLIALLLFFVSSPGEEIFWRGFVQRNLQRFLGPIWGMIAAVFCYAAVHLLTGNPVLVLAALVAGLYWGLLYHYEGNLFTVIVSHALWTLLIFVLFPVGAG